MKIGILTYHYAHNYGAVLQCYALQEYLSSLGHTVKIIGYENSNIIKDYIVFDIRRFLMRNPISLLKRIFHEIKYYNVRRERHNAFEGFIKSRLNICKPQEIMSEPFDLIIIGSDQVWNYKLTNGFDFYYWGGFYHPKTTELATYAVSMQDNWPADIDEEIKKKISNFQYLSVREEKLAKKLSQIVPNRNINVVVDPTLLFKSYDWNKVAEKPQINFRYLLLYQVDTNSLAEAVAAKVAEELNVKIIRLFAQPDKPHSAEVANCSPCQFVGLFKYADFVVCSSFHGTVFSIMYKKPFYSIRVPGKSSRVETLLEKFNLSEFLISKVPPMISKVNYQNIPSDISEKSKAYLKEITNSNE